MVFLNDYYRLKHNIKKKNVEKNQFFHINVSLNNVMKINSNRVFHKIKLH